jgi:hypothetical protein
LEKHHNLLIRIGDKTRNVYVEYKELKDKDTIRNNEGKKWAKDLLDDLAEPERVGEKRVSIQPTMDVYAQKKPKLLNGLFGVRNENDALTKMFQLSRLVWAGTAAVSFHAMDNPHFRRMFDIYISNAKSRFNVPKFLGQNVDRTRGIAELYALVMHYQLTGFSKVQAFSICSDIWTSRNSRLALMAIVYHYSCPLTLKPMESVFDVVPITDNHSAANIARITARRVDMRTEENGAAMYSGTTDNASAMLLVCTLFFCCLYLTSASRPPNKWLRISSSARRGNLTRKI